MHFKLLVVFVEDSKTDVIMGAAERQRRHRLHRNQSCARRRLREAEDLLGSWAQHTTRCSTIAC